MEPASAEQPKPERRKDGPSKPRKAPQGAGGNERAPAKAHNDGKEKPNVDSHKREAKKEGDKQHRRDVKKEENSADAAPSDNKKPYKRDREDRHGKDHHYSKEGREGARYNPFSERGHGYYAREREHDTVMTLSVILTLFVPREDIDRIGDQLDHLARTLDVQIDTPVSSCRLSLTIRPNTHIRRRNARISTHIRPVSCRSTITPGLRWNSQAKGVLSWKLHAKCLLQ